MVGEESMAGFRQIQTGGSPKAPALPKEDLLPPALPATSLLTKHLAVLSLNREISCAHINQPLSSWKAQFSPGQACLKAKALPQEGKRPSSIYSQTWYTTVFSLAEMLFHPMFTHYENNVA